LRSSDAVLSGRVPAVIGRTEGGRLLLDLRAVPEEDDEALAAAVIAAGPAAAAAGTATGEDPSAG
jgi:L-seryl-tRNA(Ser) seleniumtransferase